MKYKLNEFYAILNERILKVIGKAYFTGEESAVQMCISVRIHQSLASFSSQNHRLHLKTEIINGRKYKLNELYAILNERM